ncbi:hypothetical protein D9M71_241000 [compost metagenome]
MELHLHPAVLVGPDFLALGADHHCGLRAVGEREGRVARGAVGQGDGLHGEMRFVERFLAAGGIAALAEVVVGAHHQVVAILVAARVPVQGEGVAGHDARQLAVRVGALAQRLALFQAHTRVLLGVGLVDEAAHPVVHLELVVVVQLRAHLQLAHVGLGLGEVIVADHVAAGTDFLAGLPVIHADLVGVDQTVRRQVGQYVVRGDRHVGAHVVGEHQGLAGLAVLEEVVDAFLLHQPADEVEVRLLVLHAVFPLPVGGLQALLHGVVVVAEDLVEDFHHALLLEDLAVRGTGQEPQPRPHREAIDVVARGAALAADQVHARHLSAQVPCAFVAEVDGQAQRLAERLLDVQAVVGTQDLQLEFVERRQRFAAAHGAKTYICVAERALERDDAIHSKPPDGNSSMKSTAAVRPVLRG